MSYLTMEDQIKSHINFLRGEKFNVDTLLIDKGFVRCTPIDNLRGRGEYCYKTAKNILNRGFVGLVTWVRTENGITKTHKTYGLSGPEGNTYPENHTVSDIPIECAKHFWNNSNVTGESEYLLNKGVGYYGVRFRESTYGKVVVIPMRDLHGNLISYQLINPDGSKRYATGVPNKGLMHMLQRPINGKPIGLTESYVVAASCFEITGIAQVTAFCCSNLKNVGLELRKFFPLSPILIFGDNDRHLSENKGLNAAKATKEVIGEVCEILVPHMEEMGASRENSDWNDYVREYGVNETRKLMSKELQKNNNLISLIPHRLKEAV